MKAPDWVRKQVKHEMSVLHLSPVDSDMTYPPFRIEILRRCIPDGSPRCSLLKGFLECLQGHYILCEVYGYPLGEAAYAFRAAIDGYHWGPPYRQDGTETVGTKADKVMAFVESIYALSHPIRGHEQTFRSTDLHRNTYPE